MGTNFTDLATTDAITAANLNDRFDELDAYIGGSTADDQLLKEWAEGGDYEATSITRDSDGVATTATVKWPDGSAGTFTTTTKNSTWFCVDAYTITHSDSSKTVTQSTVTRNSAGEVTTKPALTVA